MVTQICLSEGGFEKDYHSSLLFIPGNNPKNVSRKLFSLLKLLQAPQ